MDVLSISLERKPIAITGASSGIGAATARACVAAGMPVALMARRQDRLEALSASLEAADAETPYRAGPHARNTRPRVITFVGDVRDPAACNHFIATAERELGGLHAVFANAGYGEEMPTADTTEAAILEMFETNFLGSVRVAQAALPDMLRRDAGHLLLCSSCLSKMGVPRYAAYCISKSAQDHWCRALRAELAATGVKVSSVHPVGTSTEFFETASARTQRSGGTATLLDRSSARFMQPPERVAAAVVRCLRRPRGEVWTSRAMRLTLALGIAMPGLADAALARMYKARSARANRAT